MAKGQKRGNRENKKPKQLNPKSSVATSPFAIAQAKTAASPPGKSK